MVFTVSIPLPSHFHLDRPASLCSTLEAPRRRERVSYCSSKRRVSVYFVLLLLDPPYARMP